MRSIEEILKNTEQVWRNFVLAEPCREWQCYCDDAGYGYVTWNDKTALVHRVVYKKLVGPIPEGKELHHWCRNKSCCEPSHMSPLSRAEHVHHDPTIPYFNALKTRCPKGHIYDSSNTYVYPDGRRDCRTCAKEAREAYNAKRTSGQMPEIQRRGTHCKRGHELTEDNVLVSKTGALNCRTCNRDRSNAHYAAKKAAKEKG